MYLHAIRRYIDLVSKRKKNVGLSMTANKAMRRIEIPIAVCLFESSGSCFPRSIEISRGLKFSAGILGCPMKS
jgi:hypothetical protein